MNALAKRSRFPWAAIERDWRANILSQSEIARKYRVDNAQLHRRAKKQGWQKDTKDAIRTRALVALGEFEQDREQAKRGTETSETKESQSTEELIDDAVKAQLFVVLQSRKRISAALSLADHLMSELDAQTENRAAIEQLIEMVFNDADPTDSANRAALRRALSLSNRTTSMLNLANAIGKLTALQRQAFGLNDTLTNDQVASREKSVVDIRTDEERARALLNLLERVKRSSKPTLQ